MADKDAIKREFDRKALRAELKKLYRDMERKADGRALLDETMPLKEKSQHLEARKAELQHLLIAGNIPTSGLALSPSPTYHSAGRKGLVGD